MSSSLSLTYFRSSFFYVTLIGCGIAGFKDKGIAPLFSEAVGVENICLPENFVKALN